MLSVLLTVFVAFLITFFAIPAIIRVAEEKKLYDVPDARKLHSRPISSLGGIGIFTGFFIATLLSISGKLNPEFQYFFAAGLIIFFLGLKDDIIVLSATKKMLGQIIATAILIHLADVRITSMHGLFGINELPLTLSYALSYATIILVINAFNLIDGVDGLAGSLGLLTMVVFGGYFFAAGLNAYALLAFAMAGSLLAFLIFNYNPAKIFMGDCGSLVVGLVNAILVVKFISVADSAVITVPVESAVAIGISIMMVPLMDTVRVFGLRILNGRSPFSPDRNHIHHILLSKGLNHKYVTICCLLMNVLFMSMAYFGRALGPTYVLASMVMVSSAFISILIYYKRTPKPMVATRNFQQAEPAVIQPITKVVSIKTETKAAVVEH